MKNAKRLIWGLVLIALGVLYGLNELNVLPFELFFKGWWTLLIIVPSIIGLFTERDKIGNLIGLLFGVFFLLCEWDILAFDLLWKLALPVAIVLIGLRLLIGKRTKTAVPPQVNVKVNVDHTTGNGSRCVAVFSGQEMHFDGKPFHGGDAVAVFGGVDVFASTAVITADCQLNVAAVFGGVDIYLPADVNVEVTSGGVFGGVENHRRFPPIEGAPTIYINAAAVFGSVDIK